MPPAAASYTNKNMDGPVGIVFGFSRFLGRAPLQWPQLPEEQPAGKSRANPSLHPGGGPGENVAGGPARVGQVELQRKFSV